ncbi:MarR family winged helix-turn-helix transcriptional regulator [Bradyrhizobium murdochi]|uniref:MarR family winged helix-turn-helix transcriptional regulator n=1 Tax=Bradyrhizobium murdochi TaxID=1038859 RepID=UPI000687802D|nr:MarR family winged helix-turn-helix transcriptional regulator [Bradyrhizobium murdochi]
MAELSQLARTMAMECPALRVRQASRVLTKLFDDELAPFGLLSSQLPILTATAMFGDRGATMSKLARALLMDRTTLTRGIRPLQRARLIRIARSRDDARAKTVVITRAGERAIQSIFPVWERVLGQITTSLGAETLIDIHARLDQVIALSTLAERSAVNGASDCS